MGKRGEKINITGRKWRLEQFHVHRGEGKMRKKRIRSRKLALDPVRREMNLHRRVSRGLLNRGRLRSTEAIALILSDATPDVKTKAEKRNKKKRRRGSDKNTGKRIKGGGGQTDRRKNGCSRGNRVFTRAWPTLIRLFANFFQRNEEKRRFRRDFTLPTVKSVFSELTGRKCRLRLRKTIENDRIYNRFSTLSFESFYRGGKERSD